jgi:hypothetical protein
LLVATDTAVDAFPDKLDDLAALFFTRFPPAARRSRTLHLRSGVRVTSSASCCIDASAAGAARLGRRAAAAGSA